MGHFDPAPILIASQRQQMTEYATETVQTYSRDIEIYL